MNGHSGPNLRPLPLGWQWLKLRDVCAINPKRPEESTLDPGTLIDFVPMSAIDASIGVIAQRELRPYGQVEKGYTYFAEGDVLFAKITPCMQNGKTAIARHLKHGFGFGTTEFHVLRPLKDVTSEWVWMCVRYPAFREQAVRSFEGSAGQQRVPEDFLASTWLPLPPPNEQTSIATRIASQMAEVARLREAVSKQLKTAEQIATNWRSAVFESDNALAWPRSRVGDLAEVKLGRQRSPENRSNLHPTKYIRVANVFKGRLDLRDVLDMEFNPEELEKYRLKRCDLLLCEGQSSELVGRCAMWNDELSNCCFQNTLIRVRCDSSRLWPRFAFHALTYASEKGDLTRLSRKSTNIAHLGASRLADYEIAVPSLENQKQIAEMIDGGQESAERIIHASACQLEAISALSGALLGEIFGRYEPAL